MSTPHSPRYLWYVVRPGHATGELPGDRVSAALAHVLQPPILKASDRPAWLLRSLCGILFGQRVGSVILEVFSNLIVSIILFYHSIISHPEPPILTWPPFSAVSTFQGRTFHHLSRDGILLGSAYHFCSFDKIACDFLKRAHFLLLTKYCLIFSLSRQNSWQLKYSMGIAFEKEWGMALFWNKFLLNFISSKLHCTVHSSYHDPAQKETGPWACLNIKEISVKVSVLIGSCSVRHYLAKARDPESWSLGVS